LAPELPPDISFLGRSFFFVPRTQQEMEFSFPPNTILHHIAKIRSSAGIAVHMNEVHLKGGLKQLDLGPEAPFPNRKVTLITYSQDQQFTCSNPQVIHIKLIKLGQYGFIHIAGMKRQQ
jgi:hypothetical protein